MREYGREEAGRGRILREERCARGRGEKRREGEGVRAAETHNECHS